MTVPSPRVLDLEWGRMVIEGVGDVKDAKLWPGGGRAWDWTETGTRHDPGIQPADLVQLLAGGATTVVLGIGMRGSLGVCPEALETLRSSSVAFEVLRTDQAVTSYNRLAASTAVGGLFHSTC